jgi:hypothetical protein
MSAVADEDEVRGKDSSVEFHRQRAAWAEEEGEDQNSPGKKSARAGEEVCEAKRARTGEKTCEERETHTKHRGGKKNRLRRVWQAAARHRT